MREHQVSPSVATRLLGDYGSIVHTSSAISDRAWLRIEDGMIYWERAVLSILVARVRVPLHPNSKRGKLQPMLVGVFIM